MRWIFLTFFITIVGVAVFYFDDFILFYEINFKNKSTELSKVSKNNVTELINLATSTKNIQLSYKQLSENFLKDTYDLESDNFEFEFEQFLDPAHSPFPATVIFIENPIQINEFSLISDLSKKSDFEKKYLAKNNFSNFIDYGNDFEQLEYKDFSQSANQKNFLLAVPLIKFDFNASKILNYDYKTAIDIIKKYSDLSFKLKLTKKADKIDSKIQKLEKINLDEDTILIKENIIKIDENLADNIQENQPQKQEAKDKKADNNQQIKDNQKPKSEQFEIKIDDSIPEGFRDINTDERVIVSVYFSANKVADTFATVNFDNLEFDNPQSFIKDISYIKNKEEVAKALTGKLELNSSKSCFPKRFLGCNDVDTPVAAIVYNSNLYRVDLVINKNYLQKADPFAYNYLTSSQEGLSTLSNFNVNFKTDNTPNSIIDYNINSRNYISYKNFNIQARLNYDRGDVITADEIISKAYHKDQEYKFGFTSMEDLQMTSGASYFGAGIKRFYSSREKQGMIYSKRIEIYLPYYSDVRIYKDNRLYSQEFYSPGNQILDTSSLPNGSYNIKLEIIDGRGKREEVHFFTKTSRMPIKGEPFYYGDVGFLKKEKNLSNKRLPEVSSIAIGRVGGGVRLNDYFGLLGNVVGTRFESGAEAILEFQHPNYTISSKYLKTSALDNVYSIDADTSFLDKKLNLNLSFRKTTQGREDKDLSNEDAEFNLVSNSNSTFSANGNYVLPKEFGNVGLNFNRNGQQKGKYKYSYGASYDKIIVNYKGFRVNLNVKFDKSEEEKSYYTNIRTSYNKNGWSLSNTTTKTFKYTKGQRNSAINEHPLTNNIFINWDDKDLLKDQLLIGAFQNYNNNETNEQLTIDYDNSKFGRIKTTTKHDKNKTEHTGNYRFSVATNNLDFALGGQASRDGAIIAKVKGSKKSNASFIIGSRSSGTKIKNNSSKLIPKSSFRDYSINITSDSKIMNEIANPNRKVTIFPGNVVTLKFQARETAIIMGRIVNENGQGVNGVITSSLEESLSDEDGNFQIYSYSDDKITAEDFEGNKCQAELKDVEINNSGVAFVNDIECQTITDEQTQ